MPPKFDPSEVKTGKLHRFDCCHSYWDLFFQSSSELLAVKLEQRHRWLPKSVHSVCHLRRSETTSRKLLRTGRVSKLLSGWRFRTDRQRSTSFHRLHLCSSNVWKNLQEIERRLRTSNILVTWVLMMFSPLLVPWDRDRWLRNWMEPSKRSLEQLSQLDVPLMVPILMIWLKRSKQEKLISQKNRLKDSNE